MIRRMKGCITLLVFLFIGTIGQSQSSSPKQASLTVTVTVDSSVGLVLDPDGPDDKDKVIVANDPDPAQTFAPPRTRDRNNRSRKPVTPLIANTSGSTKPSASTTPALEYRFPGHAAAFEIRREIVWMNVETAGSKQREPVAVTTVVTK